MKSVKLDTTEWESHYVNKDVLHRIGKLVSDYAQYKCPVNTGRLMNSIDYEVVGNKVKIYADCPYALWVHEGTGAYASNGQGRPGYWVYVKEPGEQVYKSYESTEPILTLEQAKQMCAYLNSKFRKEGSGKIAIYTNGQAPQPFLHDALMDNEDEILDTVLHEPDEIKGLYMYDDISDKYF